METHALLYTSLIVRLLPSIVDTMVQISNAFVVNGERLTIHISRNSLCVITVLGADLYFPPSICCGTEGNNLSKNRNN